MKSMKTSVFAVIALAVVLLAVYALTGFRKGPTVPAGPTVATFFCTDDKSIEATFNDDSVSLALSDGRNLTLPHAVSGSGARYEATSTGADIVFWNKGDGAFITENDKTTFEDCVAANVKPSDTPGYDVYADQGNTFSFVFPTNFSISGVPSDYSQAWNAVATTSGMLLAAIRVPQSFEPNTNFGDAFFTVGTSADPGAVADCLKSPAEGFGTTTPVTIGNVPFTRLVFGTAGAGNRYDTVSYRTVRDNQCYAVEYTIHYGVFENYPKGSITKFDEEKVGSALDQIAQSFRFLQ